MSVQDIFIIFQQHDTLAWETITEEMENVKEACKLLFKTQKGKRVVIVRPDNYHNYESLTKWMKSLGRNSHPKHGCSMNVVPHTTKSNADIEENMFSITEEIRQEEEADAQLSRHSRKEAETTDEEVDGGNTT